MAADDEAQAIEIHGAAAAPPLPTTQVAVYGDEGIIISGSMLANELAKQRRRTPEFRLAERERLEAERQAAMRPVTFGQLRGHIAPVATLRQAAVAMVARGDRLEVKDGRLVVVAAGLEDPYARQAREWCELLYAGEGVILKGLSGKRRGVLEPGDVPDVMIGPAGAAL